MELFLVVGAVVLIALTVWIVWPARTTAQLVEAPDPPMTEPSLPPQGDAFEDQYTSATADLSAAGVATSFQAEPVVYTPATPAPAWPAADTTSEPIEVPARSESFRYPPEHRTEPTRAYMEPRQTHSTSAMRPRTLTVGAGLLVSMLSAIAGAWVYARWQHRHQAPTERLRRRLKG